MNMGIIIAVVLAGLLALGVFFGLIGGISKTFPHTQSSSIDSSSLRSQEQQTIEDTEDKQRKLMDDMRQKIQDAGH